MSLNLEVICAALRLVGRAAASSTCSADICVGQPTRNRPPTRAPMDHQRERGQRVPRVTTDEIHRRDMSERDT